MQLRYFILLLLLGTIHLSVQGQGNGADGALIVNTGTTTTINSVATSVTGTNAAGYTINVASTTGFSVNDMALVMQMSGTNEGTYNELKITSLTATSLTFATSTTVTFSTSGAQKAQVMRIPQYSSITINAGGTLTAPAWNGSTGGILVYYSSGNVTVNGLETMDGKGFTGGAGGTGSTGGTGGSAGAGGATANSDGNNAGGTSGSAGGSSLAGQGGSGGTGSSASITAGAAGTGSGGGILSGDAGTNVSSGLVKLLMGGGGSGGQGGQGGQGGGGGGGGGAASSIAVTGAGLTGNAGSIGTASTGTGGQGGNGGGIILKRVKNIGGSGTISSNGSNGANATGTGGKGGNGGNGGNGGSMLAGLLLTNGGGGGGGGTAGQGGQGPGGGGGGGGGIIAIITHTNTWTGTLSNSSGSGGTGGSGGAAGSAGTGGTAGAGFLFGTSGNSGAAGTAATASLAGPNGTPSASSLAPMVLPVEFLTFIGIANEKGIMLTWETAWEKDNVLFTIERSSDAKHFHHLGQTKGANNSSTIRKYQFEDREPLAHINYYRIKQTDVNGHESYSAIITENYAGTSEYIKTHPNPIQKQEMLSVTLQEDFLPVAQQVNISLLNSYGATVFIENVQADNNVLKLFIPAATLPGLYYLHIKLCDKVFTEKVIVRE